MAKGDGPNPAEEMLFRLSLDTDFTNDLKRARKSLGVPSGGLDPGDKLRWLQKNRARGLDLLAVEFNLQKKYGIPLAFQLLLTDYILCNKPTRKNIPKDPPVLIDKYAHVKDDPRRSNMEDLYMEFGEPFVKLFIFGGGTKTEVLDFIKKNWSEIECLLVEQGAAPRNATSRVRKVLYKDRDRIIRELWKWPAKALRQEILALGGEMPSPRMRFFKDILVRKLLQLKYDIRVSESYIRKISGTGYLSTRKPRQ